MERLSGKVALVTGGARGIGAAISTTFAREGAKIVITDVLAAEGQALAAQIGPNALFMELDVTSLEEWEATVGRAEKAFGPVSVLVNNAGVRGTMKPVTEMTQQEYQRVIDVNQLSVFLGIRSVVPSMQRAGGGSIINTSSAYGLVGAAMQIDYCGSKFAVTGMTKAAARELADQNIRVNSVHPGLIRTPMSDEALAFSKTDAASFASGFPFKRMGTAQEIADAFLFLASEEASFVTGAAFSIDGGLTA